MAWRNYFPSLRGRGAPALARPKRLFKDKLTGKKSGALPLTMRGFTIVAQPAGNDPFTARRAAIVVACKARFDLKPVLMTQC